MKFSFPKWMSGLFIAISLSACGGGGGSSSDSGNQRLGANANAGTPEGVYEGVSSTGFYFDTIILENNRFYTIYGTISNDVFLIEGFFTGMGQANNGTFTATDVRDFDANGLDSVFTLSASYQPGKSFNGSTSNGTSTVSFTSTPPATTNYQYNTPAKLSNIAGTWVLQSLAGDNVTLNIASNGNYTATYFGCDFEGRFTPRATGKNVFDVSVTGGGSAQGTPCNVVVPSTTAHAVEYALANGGRQLIITGTDEERETGTLLIGAR